MKTIEVAQPDPGKIIGSPTTIKQPKPGKFAAAKNVAVIMPDDCSYISTIQADGTTEYNVLEKPENP